MLTNWACSGCGFWTQDQYFLIDDNLWQHALAKLGLDDRAGRVLCIHCIEKAIDRKLTMFDFNPLAEINKRPTKSKTLENRRKRC